HGRGSVRSRARAGGFTITSNLAATILRARALKNMPTKKTDISQEIYRIKVTLLGTRPPIWRRLLVPADLTLEQLHDVLQLAMGWEDWHLHVFRIGEKRFGKPNPEESLMGMP